MVITGAGRAFSAGYDIGAIPDEPFERDAEALVAHPFHAAMEAVSAHPYPVVAAINGHCLGGGLELAVPLRPAGLRRGGEARHAPGEARPDLRAHGPRALHRRDRRREHQRAVPDRPQRSTPSVPRDRPGRRGGRRRRPRGRGARARARGRRQRAALDDGNKRAIETLARFQRSPPSRSGSWSSCASPASPPRTSARGSPRSRRSAPRWPRPAGELSGGRREDLARAVGDLGVGLDLVLLSLHPAHRGESRRPPHRLPQGLRRWRRRSRRRRSRRGAGRGSPCREVKKMPRNSAKRTPIIAPDAAPASAVARPVVVRPATCSTSRRPVPTIATWPTGKPRSGERVHRALGLEDSVRGDDLASLARWTGLRRIGVLPWELPFGWGSRAPRVSHSVTGDTTSDGCARRRGSGDGGADRPDRPGLDRAPPARTPAGRRCHTTGCGRSSASSCPRRQRRRSSTASSASSTAACRARPRCSRSTTMPCRGAGLSARKVEDVKDLAQHVVSGELEVERLGDLTDEKVIDEVIAVRAGASGPRMFLIFHLEREDVLPCRGPRHPQHGDQDRVRPRGPPDARREVEERGPADARRPTDAVGPGTASSLL